MRLSQAKIVKGRGRDLEASHPTDQRLRPLHTNLIEAIGTYGLP
jgi:hypothetical protein